MVKQSPMPDYAGTLQNPLQTQKDSVEPKLHEAESMLSTTKVKDIFARVKTARQANEDVYKWPGPIWDLLYVIEEATELARGLQRKYEPDHARNSPLKGDMDLTDYLHLEWGQTLMMLVTLGIELELDGDRALEMAIKKIYATSERRRSED